jgi:transposase
MPNPLSTDLRERIAKEFELGELTSEKIAEKFSVSMRTIMRLRKSHFTEGHVRAKESPRNTGNTKIKDLEAFSKFVIENPDLYQEEIAQKFGVSQATICNMLAKLKITRKKTYTYKEKN